MVRAVLDVLAAAGLLAHASLMPDEGPGVADSFVPVLFDEFTRETGRGRQGTGLGLHVVRSLAAAQGGDVTCRRLGGTTDFTLRLPPGGPDEGTREGTRDGAHDRAHDGTDDGAMGERAAPRGEFVEVAP